MCGYDRKYATKLLNGTLKASGGKRGRKGGLRFARAGQGAQEAVAAFRAVVLKPFKAQVRRRRNTGTKPGTLLKNQIPVRRKTGFSKELLMKGRR